MVFTEKELISKLKESLEYKEGVLYWKTVKNLGKKAGYKNSDGYIEINVSFGYKTNKKFLSHRVIFAIHHNYFPLLVDHIDQNPENNLISNLRDANKKLNAINTGLPNNNNSGIKGVRFNKNAKCYEAYINTSINGKRKKIHLGIHKTIELAKEARTKAENKYWYDT